MKRPPAAIAAALALALGGCDDPGGALRLIVDTPPATSEAYPFDIVDQLRLSIAEAGDADDINLVTADVGEPLVLANVPFSNDLVVHLAGLAVDVEVAYGRTCILDLSDEGRVDSTAHLYLSRAVKWGEGRDPIEADRVGALAYALPDGSAVFLGGDGGEGLPPERFDPTVTGAFAPLSFTPLPRVGGVIGPFSNGSAAIIGGSQPAGALEPRIEVIDPQRGTVDVLEGLSVSDHAAATLVDDRILVAGGRDGSGAAIADAFLVSGVEIEILDPVRLETPRAQHTLTRLSDEVGADVLVAGGRTTAGNAVGQAELFRPLRETFVTIAGAVLNVPRWDHRAIRLPGGFVLIVGGLTDDPDGPLGPLPPDPTTPTPVTALELYDPVEGLFIAAGQLPANAGINGLTATLLPDGRVLLAGGRDAAGAAVATAVIARLDPIDGRVDISPTDALSAPRAGHSAVALCDGTILVTGGGSGPAVPGSERYNPPSAGRR